LDEKRSVIVSMMKTGYLTTPYFRDEELSCTVVELKYTGNASAMFILPDQGRMQQVEASLQPETLRKWKNSLKPRYIDKGPRTGKDPRSAVVLMSSSPVTQESHLQPV
jgi:serpin peptidase inhibitor clade A protein 3